MKILVTGAGGFIGSAVVPELLRSGHTLTLLRRNDGGTQPNPADGQLNVLRADPADWKKVVAAHTFDVCLHLAWVATPGVYLHSPENDFFASCTLELARQLFENGTTHFIGAGSCIEYTKGQTTPCDEIETSSNPLSPYGLAKNRARQELSSLAEQYGTKWTWARIFYPYGPGEHHARTVSTFLRTLTSGKPLSLKTGQSIKDFIDIRDVAAAFSRIIDTGTPNLINIGTGRPTSIMELALLVAKVAGADPGLVQNGEGGDDPYAYHVAKTSRLESIGFKPSISLEEGVSQLFHTGQFARLS